jgi:CAAX prenyl protease-like protein
MVDRTNLYRIAPFGAYVFFMILEDALLKFGWEPNELHMLYAVKIAVVAGLLWAMRSAYSELRWPSGAGLRLWVAALAAGVVVFIAWINLTADWMVMGESVGFDPRENGEIDWFW